MKKYLILLLIVFVIVSLTVAVLAVGQHGPAGISNIAHLYLHEKDANWDIVDGGAWGKITYNLSGSTFDFVFNGHGLVPGNYYTLINYKSWSVVICLGSGIADEYGDVHIADSVDTGNLTGAKIWLVLSDDVDCENAKMIGWDPTEWLFEYDLITFTEE